MPGSMAPIPSPSEAGRPLGLQPMQMAVLQGAHFLQESSAGNAENQLENLVLHEASSLRPVLQKEVRRSSAVRAADPTGFSKLGLAGGAVSGTPCKTYVWADSLVPVYPCKWGQGERQGSKKFWPACMNPSWLCKSLWLLIRMCHHLGKVPRKQRAGCPLLRNTLAERVGAPGCGNVEAHSLLPRERLMLLYMHQDLSPPSPSPRWLRAQDRLPPHASQGSHPQQAEMLLRPQ